MTKRIAYNLSKTLIQIDQYGTHTKQKNKSSYINCQIHHSYSNLRVQGKSVM
jgi:hypothetical protein